MNPCRVETPATGGVCNHCNSNDHWVLHNVKHRGAYRRLCTTCVLKLYHSFYCAICFSLYDRPKKAAAAAPATPIIRSTLSCFKCGSFSHTSCVLPNVPKSPYLCPICSNPHSKLFDFRKEGHGTKGESPRPAIDLKSSKAFVAAAKIAANLMNEEAEFARAEAERRAKEVVVARKRAREALESVALIWAKERGRSGIGEGARVPMSAMVPANSLGVKSGKSYPVGGKRLVNVGGKRIEGGALVPANSPISVHKRHVEGSNVAGEMEAKLLLVNKDGGGNCLQTSDTTTEQER